MTVARTDPQSPAAPRHGEDGTGEASASLLPGAAEAGRPPTLRDGGRRRPSRALRYDRELFVELSPIADAGAELLVLGTLIWTLRR